MKLKLSVLILIIFVCIFIFTFTLKENYTNTKSEGNGYPFFERTIMPNPNLKTYLPEYNGYCTTYNSVGDCKFDNTNEIILDLKSTIVFDNFLKSFNGNIIGKLYPIYNENYRIKGNYGQSDFNINKVISGQNNLPGTLTNIDTNVPINLEINNKLLTSKEKLPDIGYASYIKNLFISYINKKGTYNFIALNSGKVSIKDNIYTIPFFIYEAKLNYTRGIVCIFTIKSNNDIEITNVIEQDLIPKTLNLEPVNINNNIFDNPILDTNGYFQIQNRLGLMYPFRTSTTGIIEHEDPNTFFKKTSEGNKISYTELQAKIKDYEITSGLPN